MSRVFNKEHNSYPEMRVKRLIVCSLLVLFISGHKKLHLGTFTVHFFKKISEEKILRKITPTNMSICK
jgi:hypothetical protein